MLVGHRSPDLIDVEQPVTPVELLRGAPLNGNYAMRVPIVTGAPVSGNGLAVPVEIPRNSQSELGVQFGSRQATLRAIGDGAVSLSFLDDGGERIPFAFAAASFDPSWGEYRDNPLWGRLKWLATTQLRKRGFTEAANKIRVIERTSPMTELILRQAVEAPRGIWNVEVRRDGLPNQEGTPNDMGVIELALWHITRSAIGMEHKYHHAVPHPRRTTQDMSETTRLPIGTRLLQAFREVGEESRDGDTPTWGEIISIFRRNWNT